MTQRHFKFRKDHSEKNWTPPLTVSLLILANFFQKLRQNVRQGCRNRSIRVHRKSPEMFSKKIYSF